MSRQSVVDDWGNSNIIDVPDEWSESQKRKASNDWSLQNGKGPRTISPVVPQNISTPTPSLFDRVGGVVNSVKDTLANEYQDIKDNFSNTYNANAARMAKDEERSSAKDVEHLGTLVSPFTDTVIGKVTGLQGEPTTKEIYPDIIERGPEEQRGIPELRLAGIEKQPDMLAARHRAAGRAALDFTLDPTNLALAALTTFQPEMAPLIGLGFGAPMVTEGTTNMVEGGLRGELPNREDLARTGVGLMMSGAGHVVPELKDATLNKLTSIGDSPLAKKFARQLDSTARGLGYVDNPLESLQSNVVQKGLVPTPWMREQGIKHTNKGWFDAEGNPTDGRKIREMYEADLAMKKAAERAPGPKGPIETLPPGTPVSQPSGVPSLSEFMQKNPRMPLPELKAKYNELVQVFTDTQPKTVEQAIGDVGELPPEMSPTAPEVPTGDFVKDILEKPVETVQPVNDLPTPMGPEMPEDYHSTVTQMTSLAQEWTPGPGRTEVANLPDGTRLVRSGPDNAAIAVVRPDGTVTDISAARPGSMSAGRVLTALKESGATPPEPGFMSPQATRAAEHLGRVEAPVEDFIASQEAKAIGGEPVLEKPPADYKTEVLDKPLEAAPVAEEPTGNFAKDVLEKPIEVTGQEQVWEEGRKAKVASEQPTGDFQKDVLEQPVSVQEAPRTIDSEALPVTAPAPPEKTVLPPETIVQEPSTPPASAGPPVEPARPKMSWDSVLEEMFPGKESYTKAELKAAKSELMSRLRKAGGEKKAAAKQAEVAKINELQPGEEEGPPPTEIAKVKGESDGKAPLMPLGSPGLISRLTLDTRTNLGKIHPHLKRWFDKFQRDSEGMMSDWVARRREITKGIKGANEQAVIRILDTKEGEQMAVAHALQDRPKMYELLKADPTLQAVLEAVTKDPTLIEKASKIRELQDEVHTRAEASKVAIGYREHHFPHYFEEGGFTPNVKPQAMPKTGTTTRRMSKLERSRLSLRKDYVKHLDVLDQYYQQAAQRISEAENFGKRHQKVAKWFQQTEGTHPHAAQYFDKAMQRITGNEEPGWWKSALGKARRLQALTDLGLAAPLQLGQASHTAAYGGVMRSLEAAHDMTSNARSIGLRALKSAALTPDIGIEALGAVRGKWTGGGYMHGIPTMDKAMRVHAFRVGELLHRDAVAGNKGAVRSLERLGVKDVSKVTPEQLGKLLSDKSQFRTGQLDLPLWASSPLGRTASMYTSFMYQHTKFMMGMMRNPGKNAAAIAKFAVIGSIAGEGVNDIRAVLKGRNPVEDEKFKKKEAQWIDVLRNRRIPATSPLKREIQNLASLGGVGIFQVYLERLQDPQSTLATLAGGPIAANAEQLVNKSLIQPKGAKKKAKAVGQWALQQVPVFGYDLSSKLLPNKRRSVADPLMNVEGP